MQPSMIAHDEQLLIKSLRLMQIITAALVIGLVNTRLIAIVFISPKPVPPNPPGDAFPVLTAIAVAAFVALIPLSFLLPRLITKKYVSRIVMGNWQPAHNSNPVWSTTIFGQLLSTKHAASIVGLALLEGVGFLACIACMIEHRMIVLAVVAAVVVLMLLRFPTADKLRNWIAQQADEIDLLRQGSTQ